LANSSVNWLTLDAVVQINALLLRGSTETHVLLDGGKLEGALGRPENAYVYENADVVVLAVRLLFGIAAAHAFEQGNKRTGFVAAAIFLEANGYQFRFPDTVAIADLVIEVVDRKKDEAWFEEFVRPFVEPL
jgi:death-on-curing protein